MPSSSSLSSYGVVMFDDPNVCGSGISCSYGQSVQRFDSSMDIPTYNVHITNCNFNQFVSARLKRTPKFRSNDYLRLKLNQIISELGYSNNPIEEQVLMLTYMFHQVMELADTHLALKTAPRNTLSLGLRDALGFESPEVDPELEYIIKAASQSYTFCSRDPNSIRDENKKQHESLFVMFRSHRQTYSQELLSTEVPSGKWRRIRTARNASQDDLLKKIEEIGEEKPVLVKVAIHRFKDESIGHLLNHGAGAHDHKTRSRAGHNTSQPNLREWVSLPEFMMLQEFAEFDICSPIMAADKYVENLCQSNEPIGLFDPYELKGREPLDYATGIYLENLWVSMSRPSTPSSAASMWLSAIDRMKSFLCAMPLANHSDVISVRGMSHGRVWCEISACCEYEKDKPWPEELQEQIAKIALETNLIPPMLSACDNKSTRHKLVMDAANRMNTEQGSLTPQNIEMMSVLLGLKNNLFDMNFNNDTTNVA